MDQHVESHSVYKLFADNLRRQCNRFESIAAFCRQSGINRQQFNRYLSGQNLPNPRSLKRICETLGVTETSLFASHAQQSGQALAPGAVEHSGWLSHFNALPSQGQEILARALKALRTQADNSPAISPGVYFVYMPMPDYSGHVLRTALKVSRIGGLTTFTRRTAFRNFARGTSSLTVGKHVGIVLSDVYATIFLGMNSFYPQELSVIRLRHSASGLDSIRIGLSMIRSTTSELATKVAFIWVGSGFAAERRAMKMIGILPISDPSVPSAISAALPNAPCDNEHHDYLELSQGMQDFQRVTLDLKNKG